MRKERGQKKKHLLKAIAMCFVTAIVLGLFVFWYNSYSTNSQTYKESEEKLDVIIAKQFEKKPRELTREDYEIVEDLNVSGLTNPKPLLKLKNLQRLMYTYDLNSEIDIRPLAKLKNLKSLNINRSISSFGRFGGMITTTSRKKNWREKIISLFKKTKSNIIENEPFDIGQLAKFKNLEGLRIQSYCEMKAGNLSGLKNLISLELDNSLNLIKYEEISRIFEDLENLEYLKLGQFDVIELSSIENLTNLKRLNLYYAKIDNINSLESLTKLEELDLSYTLVNDITILQNLRNLKNLRLSTTKIYDISPLENLVNLKFLDISNTSVSNIESIGNLINLEKLDISHTNINDLKSLYKLANLQEVIVLGLKVSDEQIAELQQALPELRIVK